MWRSLGVWFTWLYRLKKILVVKIGFTFDFLWVHWFLYFTCLIKCSLQIFLTIYMFLECLWILCMSLLIILINSFKYMLVYRKLWCSMDSYVRILEFMCKYLEFGIICEFLVVWVECLWHGLLWCFQRNFNWTFTWILKELEILDF